MRSKLSFTDGTTAHHVRFDPPERTEQGDYTVRIYSGEDDTQGHVLSVAMAVDGFLKVSARDARAMRVDVHDEGGRRWFRATPESSEDVSGHALEEHSWEISAEESDVQGHDASKATAANVAFGAATAFVAMRNADHQRIHRASIK